MTKDEEALEEAREKVHGNKATDADRKRFKELSAKVQQARSEARKREGR